MRGSKESELRGSKVSEKGVRGSMGSERRESEGS